MAFRARQKIKQYGFGCARMIDVEDKVDEDGKSLVHLFDPHLAVLPDGSMFDLDQMIKAKVDLQKTNTKVLGGNVFGVADALSQITEDDLKEGKDE